ncbi:hypothetical protein XENOCAPTIV_023727 [Xenoophorus captivus]|uniref:Uncharacterized protein n=1 Tax=Xenoophorus captivus TaxID=1517983 RepID=A0ABV0SHL5_9TELE
MSMEDLSVQSYIFEPKLKERAKGRILLLSNEWKVLVGRRRLFVELTGDKDRENAQAHSSSYASRDCGTVCNQAETPNCPNYRTLLAVRPLGLPRPFFPRSNTTVYNTFS